MKFSDLSLRIQEILRPYHVMPCVDTLLALDWMRDGLDPEKQIIPLIEETVARKLKAGKPIPTSMRYYDRVLQGLKASPQPNTINETEHERDLRRARQYRWKLTTLIGTLDINAERSLKALQTKYGEDFGIAPRSHL